VQSAIDGDFDSFGKLCEQYYAAMTAVAYCVLNDRHLAEDAVQEGYARALVKLPDLRHVEKFGSWLTSICRNMAINIARKQNRCMSIEDVGQLKANKSENSQNHREIHRAIAKLPTQTRELLTMRYFSNMSYEQISDVSGLTIAAINARLHRARKKLAKSLRNTVDVEGWL
jgi:RNA polymerase sigma-70 factor (ECF subfamily)